MPKIKTHSGASKRFSLTGTGKVKRNQSGRRHKLNASLKSAKRKRQLRGAAYADKTNETAIKRQIPYA